MQLCQLSAVLGCWGWHSLPLASPGGACACVVPAHQCPGSPTPPLLAFLGSTVRVVPEQSQAVTAPGGDASPLARTPPGTVQKMGINLIRETAVPG